MEEILVGTVKGPGEDPHEYAFITTDSQQTRIGEFVYYHASIPESGPDEEWRIVGTITGRRLVRGLPDSFLTDPRTAPAEVSSLLGLSHDNAEIYEISVETIGYFNTQLSDFVNPRIPAIPGQPIYLASNEMLSGMLSP
ncbi:MAG: ATP-binding protein, partial [Acidobacteriota bacterium]